MTERRCVSCWQVKDRTDLIKITADNSSGNVVINPNSLTFGRSAYLCYNNICVENAFKKDRLKRVLKAPVPQELKGKLLNELRDS